MKRFLPTLFASLLALSATVAHGQAPATRPALAFAKADPAFAGQLDLSSLRTMAVQHQQTVKTLDSYARQTLDLITGHSTFEGQDPVYTVLDIACRPSDYAGRDMIKVRNVPLRTAFRRLAFLTHEQQEQIVNTGMVSLELMSRDEVRGLLQNEAAADVRKSSAVQQLFYATQTLGDLCASNLDNAGVFLPVAAVPPVDGATQWQKVADVAPADPTWANILKAGNRPVPAAPPGYTADAVRPILSDAAFLCAGWQVQDPKAVNDAAASLAKSLVAVDPAVYPSMLKRQVEVIYNRLAKLTLPGAAFYFLAFVCFLMSARSGVPSLRLWGLRFLTLGLLVHTASIAVRWWLVGSIPIKNEFESVMFSAWFGVLVGFGLELGLIQAAVRALARPVGVEMGGGTPIRSVFGTAAGFVGWLSLIALFTVPLVTDTSIGQEIGMSNGVLYSYWLYIHVTMVTASYALIGMGFCLSAWWLVKYYADRATLGRISHRQLEGEARGFDVVYPGGGSAAVAGGSTLNLGATLARMAFFPVAQPAAPRAAAARQTAAATVDSKVSFLAALDACNLVVLQLAFWVLGAGIVFGAIWADMSWGRPWGWDPKETFALITWIVYLIVVHVRVSTEYKAWWTAVLSCVGFFVMLFNWIGVNFFLHGLHSYAG